MDNPACSTVDVPPLHKTDHSSTSLFDDSELELQCYHNEGVIVDDEERSEDKTEHDDDISMSKAEYSDVVLNIIQSSPSWKNKDSSEIHSNSESDDIDKEDGNDTLKADDNYRGSDGESSNISLCSTYSEPYIKRKRSEDMDIDETDFYSERKDLPDVDKDGNASIKKMKLEDGSNDKLKVQRNIIPSKENPPIGIHSWIQKFQEWSHAERLVALTKLIDTCNHSQVRYMMQAIEPQFQRDFISLLPKELALYVLSFLQPRDLLRAAQTCRYWKCLTDDNLLWREKCIEAGIDLDSVSVATKRNKNRVPNSAISPWKLTYLRKHSIEMNWRVNPVRASKILKGHDDHVITCLQFCGNKIVSGSDDNTLKVWSVTSGKCLRTLVGHTGGVWSSQMSGNTIISGSTDRTLKVWNADTGHCIHTLYGHTSTVRCMHLHGNIVVSGSRDMTLRVWNIDTGGCLHVLVGHSAAVRCVQYDGRLVVSGAYDSTVKVWDPQNETCLHTLAGDDGHTNRVYSLQFDGVHVVSGSLDTTIKVWDVETGALKHTLLGHQSLTSGMELRNNILVSGNADSTVKVWDIITGTCLQTLKGPHKHQSAVTCLQFNEKFVITSSDDGTVKLWDVNTGEFIRDLVSLESGGSGGVVWRIRASETKLVCAVGSRNGTEETKLLVLDFDVETK